MSLAAAVSHGGLRKLVLNCNEGIGRRGAIAFAEALRGLEVTRGREHSLLTKADDGEQREMPTECKERGKLGLWWQEGWPAGGGKRWGEKVQLEELALAECNVYDQAIIALGYGGAGCYSFQSLDLVNSPDHRPSQPIMPRLGMY